MKTPRRKIDAALKATIASEARFVVSKTSVFDTKVRAGVTFS